MSTARVTLKFGEIPFEAFFAGAANVIFRHASTGVWVKEVREYVREYAREKSWWTLFVGLRNFHTQISAFVSYSNLQ